MINWSYEIYSYEFLQNRWEAHAGKGIENVCSQLMIGGDTTNLESWDIWL